MFIYKLIACSTNRMLLLLLLLYKQFNDLFYNVNTVMWFYCYLVINPYAENLIFYTGNFVSCGFLS